MTFHRSTVVVVWEGCRVKHFGGYFHLYGVINTLMRRTARDTSGRDRDTRCPITYIGYTRENNKASMCCPPSCCLAQFAPV